MFSVAREEVLKLCKEWVTVHPTNEVKWARCEGQRKVCQSDEEVIEKSLGEFLAVAVTDDVDDGPGIVSALDRAHIAFRLAGVTAVGPAKDPRFLQRSLFERAQEFLRKRLLILDVRITEGAGLAEETEDIVFAQALRVDVRADKG